VHVILLKTVGLCGLAESFQFRVEESENEGMM